MYGFPPPTIPSFTPTDTSNVVQYEHSTREEILRKLHYNLAKAQKSMKHWANAYLRELQFIIGDWVYIRLRPHRQTSVTGQTSGKLQKRFFGPFQITNKIRAVAYELALPLEAKIHNIFHVYLLRPHKGPLPSSPLTLPHDIFDNQHVLVQLVIIDWKWDNYTPTSCLQVLVQWKDIPFEEVSQELWDLSRDQFHHEDKVLFEQGGDVRNIGPISLTIVANIESTKGLVPNTHDDPQEGLNLPNTALEERPRRETCQPQRLNDYVVTILNNHKKGNYVMHK